MKLLLSLLLIIGLLAAVNAQGVAETTETPEELRKVHGWNWDIPSFQDILASASSDAPMNFKHSEKRTEDDKGDEIPYDTNAVIEDDLMQSEDVEDELIHALDDYDELDTAAVEESVAEEKKNEAPEDAIDEHTTAQSSGDSELDKSLKLKIKLDLQSSKAKEATSLSSEDELSEEEEEGEGGDEPAEGEGKEEEEEEEGGDEPAEGEEEEEEEGGESKELSESESKMKKMKKIKGKLQESSGAKRKIRSGRRFRNDNASLIRSLRLQKRAASRLRTALRNPRFVVRAYPAISLFQKCNKSSRSFDSCEKKQFKALKALHDRGLSMLYARLNLAKVQLRALNKFSTRLNSPIVRKAIVSRPTLVQRLRIMNNVAERVQNRLNLKINRLQNTIQLLERAKLRSTSPLTTLSGRLLSSSIRIGPLRYTVGFTRVPEGFKKPMVRRSLRVPALRVSERPSWSSVRSPVASRSPILNADVPLRYSSQSVDYPESTEHITELNPSS